MSNKLLQLQTQEGFSLSCGQFFIDRRQRRSAFFFPFFQEYHNGRNQTPLQKRQKILPLCLSKPFKANPFNQERQSCKSCHQRGMGPEGLFLREVQKKKETNKQQKQTTLNLLFYEMIRKDFWAQYNQNFLLLARSRNLSPI